MPIPPNLAAVKAYLGDDAPSYDDSAIQEALTAETAAQADVCRIPGAVGDAYPAALDEALCRRVAHNLAVRAVPLGVEARITDVGAAITRVGGSDAEVRRLEGPYQKLLMG